MVMASMRPLAAVRFGQFDATILNAIDRTDMNSVRANNFHMLFNATYIGHIALLNCWQSSNAPKRVLFNSLRQILKVQGQHIPQGCVKQLILPFRK
jgi:hypothetical protein